VESFRNRSSTAIQCVVDGTHLVEPYEVADPSANHFQLVYDNPSPGVFPSLSLHSEFLSLSPICDYNIFKALKFLKPFKSV
jgi:hypothetical protein